MAVTHTLTDLIPTIYNARDVVSRELVGFIPAVDLDADSKRAAKDQIIRRGIVPAATTSTVAPSMTIPDGTGDTLTNRTLSIDTVESKNIPWTGEQQLSVNEAGVDRYLSQQISQAMRTLVNKAELAVAALHIKASRAYGTAGTAPFASSIADSAQIRRILNDNGAPEGDRHLVLDSAADAALNSLGQLTKVNEAGDNTLLTRGVLRYNLNGLTVRASGQVKQAVTSGTAASATTDNAGYAVGATTLTLASAGTGTILAGDVVTFAGDTNKYVVLTGDADVSGGGTIVLAEPGLRVAMSAATKAITVVAASTRSMGFSRDAIGLALRPPAMGDDAAVDSMLVTDPVSGITFDVRHYKGYGMKQIFVGLGWGVVAWKPAHIALLLG